MKIINILSILLFLLLCNNVLSARDKANHNGITSCEVCHNYNFSDPSRENNISFINDVIFTPNSGYKEVKLFSRTGTNSFADGDATHNGVCEVCHTKNNHHNNNGSDTLSHFDGEDCMRCHLHRNPEGDFKPPLNQSHRTHMDQSLAKGPHITECSVCHQSPLDTIADYQYDLNINQSLTFRDGLPLATTTACDNCHSPWGKYPGGDVNTALMDSVIGAKANFRTGIYESDGKKLKEGKEKWCITCHDDRPSTSKYDANPDAPPPTIFLSYATDTTDLNWHNPVDWAGTVPHYNNNVWAAGTWIEYGPFAVSTTGVYSVNTKYFDGASPTSDCTTVGKELLVQVSSTGGSNESKRWLQPADALDYVSLGDFNISAGDVTIKVSKDLAGCFARMGNVKVEPSGGSGGAVVFAPMIAGDDTTWGYYATGHGKSNVHCTECHDVTKMHIDYNRRTHEMNTTNYGKVVNSWGDGYRLKTKDPKSGESLCASCHDFRMIWDEGGTISTSNSRVRQTNYSQYGNDWSTLNYHKYHMALDYSNSSGLGADSDWNGLTDSSLRCANCHNVHGSARGRMFRDGRLVSDPYTTSKMPMKDVDYKIYAKAKWLPTLQGGDYNVSIWYPTAAGAATNTPFYIKSSLPYSQKVTVNQTINAGAWFLLGSYNFEAGAKGYVFVNNKGANGNIVADAVKFASSGETVIMDNTDVNYTKYGTFTTTTAADDYGADYNYIANTATSTDENPIVFETTEVRVPGVLGANIVDNQLCTSCHGGANTPAPRPAFTGPKILNRFEDKRWVLNDGSEDAQIYITAQDTDSNVTAVKLNLTSIGGGIVDMNWVEKQTFSYTIPAAMIDGLFDTSYKLPVVAYTNDWNITHETYLFPKDYNDTVYMDTNDVELHDVNDFRFAVNSDGYAPSLPSNKTYFGPGYRYTVADFATSYGIWRPDIPKTGRYEVYGFWNEQGGAVNYTTYAADKTETVTVTQSTNPGEWNLIGTYTFLDDDSGYVKQISNDGTSMVADAMKFVRLPFSSQPVVKLHATQRFNIQKADGNFTQIYKPTRILLNSFITIRASVKDDDEGDSFTYDWSGTDAAILALDSVETRTNDDVGQEDFIFNAAELAPGYYTIEVTVTDGGAQSTTVKLMLHKPEAYPTLLASNDADGDGINDKLDGLWDTDEDGIPNYLDASLAANELPDSGSLAVVVEDGFNLRLGSTAFKSGSDDVIVSNTELATYGEDGVGGLADGALNVIGGLFDFDITGLKTVGQSAKIVLPLQDGVTIPASAVYRKYYKDTGWTDFVINENNKIHSSLKVAGICPEPGSSSYTTGLTVGHQCVQLTIQDGGPNDADGLLNAEIKDPGGIMLSSAKVISKNKKSKWWLGAFEIWFIFILGFIAIGRFANTKISV